MKYNNCVGGAKKVFLADIAGVLLVLVMVVVDILHLGIVFANCPLTLSGLEPPKRVL